VISNVGWFSNAHFVLKPISNPIFTMKTNWHLYMWELDWEPTSSFHMNVKFSWEPIQIYLDIYILENWTSFLIEFRFGFHSPYIGSSCCFFHVGLLFFCMMKWLNYYYFNQVVNTRCENWLLLFMWEPPYLKIK